MYDLIHCLRLVKLFHDMGIYEDAVGDIKEIAEGDYYELIMRGFSAVAPAYEAEEPGDEHGCGGHTIHHFSDPALVEYYRLCRLYELKHALPPERNPYMALAENHYITCLNSTNGDFGSNYDDEKHPTEIWIETCPEWYVYEDELIELVHDVLEFYRNEVETLRTDLLTSPIMWLPALPPHSKAPRIGVKAAGRARKRRKKPGARKGKALKKAIRRKG